MIPLPNRSSTPRDSFKVGVDDIQLALENAQVDLTPDQWLKVVFWHSHPGGGVGPSRLDMRQKVPNLTHLVVTLETGEALFTWY